MNGRHTDPVIVPWTKQCPIVCKHFLIAFRKIGVDRFPAGRAKIDKPFFVALANDADSVFINVRQVQIHKFAAPYPAVEKQHQNRIIPFFVLPGHRFQQRGGLFHGKILGETFAKLWIFQICHRVLLQLLGSRGQIFIEGLDGRKLSGPCGRGNSVLRSSWIRVNCPVIGQIGKKVENIRCVDIPDKLNVNFLDIDVIQIRAHWHIISHELYEAQEHSQIQIVLRNCQRRLTLDIFVIDQKLPQHLGTIMVSLHKNLL